MAWYPSDKDKTDPREQLKDDLAEYIADNFSNGVDVVDEQVALQEIIKEELKEEEE